MQKRSSSIMSWILGSRPSKVMRIGWTRNSGTGLSLEKMVRVLSRILLPVLVDKIQHGLVQILAPKSLKTFTTNSRGFLTRNQYTLKPKPSTCFRASQLDKRVGSPGSYERILSRRRRGEIRKLHPSSTYVASTSYLPDMRPMGHSNFSSPSAHRET